MAEGYQDVFGYKIGDTTTFYVRSLGRVVSAGNALYTYLVTDKPILSTSTNISITLTSFNAIELNSTQAVTADTTNISVLSVARNMILFTIPTNSLTPNKAYYIEASATVHF